MLFKIPAAMREPKAFEIKFCRGKNKR
jgi:hypothetical protein